MDSQDLAYALNQVVHNFGAVSVTAGAAAGRWAPSSVAGAVQRRMAWLALVGWLAQSASGATFGVISYASYGQLPDIHGIALTALSLKIACAAFGSALSALYLARAGNWSQTQRQGAWAALLVCAMVALASAAFLRWFS